MTRRLIVAVDTPELDRAGALLRAVAPHCGLVKLGLEFFLRHGPEGYRAMAAAGADIFLDLKLHDIPNTVAGGVRSLLPLGPRLLTIHAGGGAAMVAAAVAAAAQAGASRPKILAVTVLTSLDAAALSATGVVDGPARQALRLARLALAEGADGLVCSPHEIAPLRDAFGSGPLLVVPGIRPAGAAPGDQARVMTPEQAVEAGADYIVVGRPVTAAAEPGAAAAAIARAIA
ncbi:orotidine-5'-phosphate decarboxylase [Acidocella sp.]|uniref:orotidine-5'-phosphate decarboxylase n=1 Tax=Acidocella sp. TaxID=50710 RepID=UPI00260EB1AB|nr:orotidine-5'-phosphate decarboxylase [Acidocella sp.]